MEIPKRKFESLIKRTSPILPSFRTAKDEFLGRFIFTEDGVFIFSENAFIHIKSRYFGSKRLIVHSKGIDSILPAVKGKLVNCEVKLDSAGQGNLFVKDKGKTVNAKFSIENKEEIFSVADSFVSNISSLKWRKLPECFVEGAEACSSTTNRIGLTETHRKYHCLYLCGDSLLSADGHRLSSYSLGCDLSRAVFSGGVVNGLRAGTLRRFSEDKAWLYFADSKKDFIFAARKFDFEVFDYDKVLKSRSGQKIVFFANDTPIIEAVSSPISGDATAPLEYVSIKIDRGNVFYKGEHSTGWVEGKSKVKNKEGNLQFAISTKYFLEALKRFSRKEDGGCRAVVNLKLGRAYFKLGNLQQVVMLMRKEKAKRRKVLR